MSPYKQIWVNGKIKMVHRHRAELALGKPLPPKAVVHHADDSTSDDAPLVICENQRYHFLLHVRARVLRAGGDPNTQRICWSCKALKTFAEFHGDVVMSAKACRLCINKRPKSPEANARRNAARRVGVRALKVA